MPPRRFPRWRAGVLRVQDISCISNFSTYGFSRTSSDKQACCVSSWLQEWDEDDRRYLREIMDEHEEFRAAMLDFRAALGRLLRAAHAVRNAGPRHLDVFFILNRFLRYVVSIFDQ